MSDTTTTLNPGVGGDVMDEALITQPGDGTTQAKRPRVQIGGGASGAALVEPVAAEPALSSYSIPALAVALVNDERPANYVDGELRPVSMTSDGYLRVIAGPRATVDFCDDIDFGDQRDSIFTLTPNPFF